MLFAYNDTLILVSIYYLLSYNSLMSDLLNLVADPVLKAEQSKENALQKKGIYGWFCHVLDSDPEAKVPSADLWRNVFEWTAFRKRLSTCRK